MATLEDYTYIKAEIDAFNVISDNKNFVEYSRIFLPNATYDPGNGPVRGVANIQALFASQLLQPDTVSQFSSSTQLIELHGPFDALGAASTATAVTYTNIIFFGQGSSAGQLRVFYAKYSDTLAKTGDFAPFGGWKFASRKYSEFVSYFFPLKVSAHADSCKILIGSVDWE